VLAAAPDVLLVPASGLESVGGVDGLLAAVPALAETPAGESGAVLSYDDQLMLGNGPRTGTFLATLIADFRDLAATDP
jgi:iron complex transport system substrate-binding protein